MAGQVSGPIAILHAFDTDGNLQPLQCDENAYLYVKTSLTTIDASDVTYTPSTLADWDGGTDPGNVDGALDQLAERVTDNEVLLGALSFPRRFFTTYNLCRVTVGNAFTVAINAAYLFSMLCYQNTGADGDTVVYSALLEAGDYTLRFIHDKANNRGMMDTYFKHVDDGSYTAIETGFDMYAAGSGVYYVHTATFTVSTSGLQLFKNVINGKNASSSGYYAAMCSIDIYRTAGID